MKKMYQSKHDVFALSLGGMTVITPFTAAPAIAHDRLRKRIDMNKSEDKRASRNGSPWWARRRQCVTGV